LYKKTIIIMNWKEHITTNQSILFGKPVIKNTRIPVDLILEKLGKGATREYLLKAYPHLTNEAINACLLMAAESVTHELILELA
jgi:uncharacterized protein (DUF433 family)